MIGKKEIYTSCMAALGIGTQRRHFGKVKAFPDSCPKIEPGFLIQRFGVSLQKQGNPDFSINLSEITQN